MGGGGGSQPALQAQYPQQPDPFAVAQAQTGYNINTATAQNDLNNVNQITPYGNVMYYQSGMQRVGASPGTPDTPATGGFWNGQSWQSTGGSKGTPATEGWDVPTYTRQVQLNPRIQGLVDSIPNKPLDLSWGSLQNDIFGMERNSLDPYWKQQQDQQNNENIHSAPLSNLGEPIVARPEPSRYRMGPWLAVPDCTGEIQGKGPKPEPVSRAGRR